jgi:hypothetical protein
MTPQEQEHLDHVAGSATEHQNCHQQSTIEHNNREGTVKHQIVALNALGMHVVVGETTAYCRTTDGIIGTHTSILGAFPYDFAAAAFVGMYLDKTGYDPDEHIHVVSPLPMPPTKAKEDPLGPPETTREMEEAERHAALLDEAESHGIDMDDDIPF